MPALQRGAARAEERLLGALWQSVPQNGRVHLHIIDEGLLNDERSSESISLQISSKTTLCSEP